MRSTRILRYVYFVTQLTPTLSTLTSNNDNLILPRAALTTINNSSILLTRQDNAANDKCCKKKRCKRKNFFKPPGSCSCIPCPPVMKPAPARWFCIPDPDKDEPTREKGKCPKGQILDRSAGYQDETTENPACVADDSRLCGDDEVPTTLQPNSESKCAKDTKRKDKPRCKGSEYRHVEVDSETNQANYSCKKTQKFSKDKAKKYDDDTKQKEKQKYDQKRQSQRPKRKEGRWAEARERERDKYAGKARQRSKKNTRKKARAGQCLVLVPLLMTAAEGGGVDLLRDAFDHDYVTSEDILALIPADMDDIDQSVDVTADSYVAQWKGDKDVTVQLSSRSVALSPAHHSLEERQIGQLVGLIIRGISALIQAISKAVPKIAVRIAKSGTSRFSR